MGYSGETNDINFSSGTTAFYGFLGFQTCSIASQSNALGQDTSNSDSIAASGGGQTLRSTTARILLL